MSLKEKVIGGVSWSIISRLGSQVFQFGFTIILARLLTPNDFGIVGLLLVFTGFAQLIGDSGFSTALIQKIDAEETHYSTVFWIQLGIGIFLSFVFFIVGKYIAYFFATPVLEQITQVISLNFFISSLGYTQQALFTKRFLFKKLAVLSLISVFVSGVFAVIFALNGFGVWALVWQILIASSVLSLLSWVLSDWKPKLIINYAACKDLTKYGLYLLGHQSVNYWLRNGDKLLIGKFLSPASLGIYSRGYNLMMLPMNNISAVLGRVMFPALAQMQGDIPRFKKAYLKSVQMIAFIAFPSMVLASVIAEPFINLVLGEKWAEVVPIFRILCWAGLLQSIVFPVNWIFTSLGKTKVQFQLSVILGILYIISILIGLKFGIVGVALAYLFISIPSAFINFVISGKYIYLSVREVFKAVSLILCMSLLMGIILALADHFYFRTQNDILRLAALTIIGITLFVLFCKVIKDATYTEFLQVVTNKILKRKER